MWNNEVGNFAKQAFSSDRSRSKRIRIFPVFAKSEKSLWAFSFRPSVCHVLTAVFILFYFILFILCLFRRKRNLRINDQRELDGKFLYALHTSMCKLYLCVCCKPGELGFFLGPPFMLCEEFKIVYKIAVGLPIAVYRLTLKWGEKIPPSPRNNKCKALLLYAFKCPCSPRAPNSGNKVR